MFAAQNADYSSENSDSPPSSYFDTDSPVGPDYAAIMSHDSAGMPNPGLEHDFPNYGGRADEHLHGEYMDANNYHNADQKFDIYQDVALSPSSHYRLAHNKGNHFQNDFQHHPRPQPNALLSTLPPLVTSAVDTSMLMAHRHFEPSSATTASSYGDELSSPYGEDQSPTSPNGTGEHRSRKNRRDKPRIKLAPDQPMTSHGKQRSRVYVACVQCRNRKIRCDGAKPTCHNCTRRKNLTGPCCYDPAPKRRGPDRNPGARQRLARDGSLEGDSDNPRRPQARRNGSSTSRRSGRGQSSASNPTSPSDDALSPVSPVNMNGLGDDNPWGALEPMQALTVAQPSLSRFSVDFMGGGDGVPEQLFTHDYQVIAPFSQVSFDPREPDSHGERRDYVQMVAHPSLEFSQKAWWDVLLNVYTLPEAVNTLSLIKASRESVTTRVIKDLRFLFRASNYWFSFLHVPRFFAKFLDPKKRHDMQPSLVLAMCSLAIFWQSSEIGQGKTGRTLALKLRDEAQSALESSINAGWFTDELAQAAWILAVFEVCAHPQHSTSRSMASMAMLDSIIRTLSLTSIDAADKDVSVFTSHHVPSVQVNLEQASKLFWDSPETPAPDAHGASCECAALSLGHRWASAAEHTPLWLSTPAWDDNWTDNEVRKESCRRLVWSTVTLAAAHSSYATAQKSSGPDLFVSNPSNYAILFPGEALTSDRTASKNSIWALNYRTMLLWHSCVRMRHDPNATDGEKAQFGVAAWHEVDALEKALNAHTCGLERSFLFQGREYLFNTRMSISYEFQRYIPQVFADNSAMHRKKAEEWLIHQATVARQVMHGLHTVTGQQGKDGGNLCHRPFFVFWFMGQISRALTLWECDNSLTTALEVSKNLLPPIDYLTALWPCPEQRVRYHRLREQLDRACYAAKLELPEVQDLSLSRSI